MLFQVQTPSKTTEIETFWQFSKSQAFIQKVKALYLTSSIKLALRQVWFLRKQLSRICSSAIPSLYFYKSKWQVLKLATKKISQMLFFELGRHGYLISQLHGSADYSPLSRASAEVTTTYQHSQKRHCAHHLGRTRLRKAVLDLIKHCCTLVNTNN